MNKKLIFRICELLLAIFTVLLLFLIVVIVPPDWVFTLLGWCIIVTALATLAMFILKWNRE